MSIDTQTAVLRARIGVEYPSDLARSELEDRLVDAIMATVVHAGGRVEVLQLDLAARPDWDQFGPVDRVTGKELWDPRAHRPGGMMIAAAVCLLPISFGLASSEWDWGESQAGALEGSNGGSNGV